MTAFEWQLRAGLVLIFGGLIAVIGGQAHLNAADYLTAYGILVFAAGAQLLTALIAYARQEDATARQDQPSRPITGGDR